MKKSIFVAAIFVGATMLALSSLTPGAGAQPRTAVLAQAGSVIIPGQTGSTVEISWPAVPGDIVNITGSVGVTPTSGSQEFLLLTAPADRSFIVRDFDLIDPFNLCDCYAATAGEIIEELPDGTRIKKHQFVVGYNSTYRSSVGLTFRPGAKLILLVGAPMITGQVPQPSLVRWNFTGFFAKN